MRIDAVIIAVLYNHFYRMQQRGRRAIPWFQTTAVLSFSIVLFFTLTVYLGFEISANGHYKMTSGEGPFLLAWTAALVAIFVVLKRTYFDSGRHTDFLEAFYALPRARQTRLKWFVLTPVVLLPFALGIAIYLCAK